MTATVHSDPYGIFMRKIGYSVGLEYTLERLSELQALYVSKKDVTAASWKNLVKENWGLKSDNITDVFYSLRLIQEISGDLIVLENLDAVAIACEMLNTDEEKQRARAFIFLWAILSNDGEIFVNLLLAKFEQSEIKKILPALIKEKRKKLLEIETFLDKESLMRICRIVNIERQEKNKGNKGNPRSIQSLIRTAPLDGHIPVISSESKRDIVNLSDEYFRKVPPRRKDWARSLNLWSDKGELTAKGKKFIFRLKAAKYIDKHTGLFMFWPMNYELIRSGFPPERFVDTIQHAGGLWDCLIDFGDAFSDSHVKFKPEEKEPDVALALLENMMSVFRGLHVRKSMLRRELPITVAYPAMIAVAVGRGEPAIDLPKALESEQKSGQRRVAVRKSKYTGYALWVRRRR